MAEEKANRRAITRRGDKKPAEEASSEETADEFGQPVTFLCWCTANPMLASNGMVLICGG